MKIYNIYEVFGKIRTLNKILLVILQFREKNCLHRTIEIPGKYRHYARGSTLKKNNRSCPLWAYFLVGEPGMKSKQIHEIMMNYDALYKGSQ